MTPRVLIIEEDLDARRRAAAMLRAQGHHVVTEASGAAGLSRLAQGEIDAVCVDVRMGMEDSLRPLYRHVATSHPHVAVVLTVGPLDLPQAIEAVKIGVDHVLPRPLSSDDLKVVMERISRSRQVDAALNRLDEPGQLDVGAGRLLIGDSPPMCSLRTRIERFAQSDAAVVVQGESGTGKELVARAIHASSPRSHRPFVVLNCAALPETLIEAELFGHVRGAFTGATTGRPGRFEAAHGGTLFLDEVGEIPLAVQAKLLRVVQERQLERLGSLESIAVDARILCATNRDLKALISEGKFREDLYYRLHVLGLRVPPLRERSSDIPLLVRHFWKVFSGTATPPQLTPAAWAALSSHSFPGNVRELEHALHHAVVLSDGGKVDLPQLPADLRGPAEVQPTDSGGTKPLGHALREFERQYLIQALRMTEGRRKKAADMLGISRKTLWEKIRLHGITD